MALISDIERRLLALEVDASAHRTREGVEGTSSDGSSEEGPQKGEWITYHAWCMLRSVLAPFFRRRRSKYGSTLSVRRDTATFDERCRTIREEN